MYGVSEKQNSSFCTLPHRPSPTAALLPVIGVGETCERHNQANYMLNTIEQKQVSGLALGTRTKSKYCAKDELQKGFDVLTTMRWSSYDD